MKRSFAREIPPYCSQGDSSTIPSAAAVDAVIKHRRGAAILSRYSGNGSDQTVICCKCGKQLLRSDAFFADQSLYCTVCYAGRKAEAERKKAKAMEKILHTPCALCGADFPQSALHPVEKQMLCDAYFQKKFGFSE